MATKNLSVASWNINGISDKLKDTDFVNTVKKFDICILLETWCTDMITIDDR